MQKRTFIVRMSPAPNVNKIMRDLDFYQKGEGACVDRTIDISWKDGELIDQERINRTKAKLKEGLEQQGYDCFSIKELV